jgi:hypothetical protein
VGLNIGEGLKGLSDSLSGSSAAEAADKKEEKASRSAKKP